VEQISWSSVLIALIGIVSAWLSARAARNAAKFSADASTANTRAQAETEAYNRARKMDIETIHRQDQEIAELHDEIRQLKEDNRTLHQRNNALRRRVALLEGEK
jgi:TolA-binding protein